MLNDTNMKKTILNILLFVLMLSVVNGQAPATFYTFPAPSVAALGLIDEIPVSLYRGMPNITVPIFEFKENGISVPIYLNYNSSGVKPDVHPGWVGMNWSLQAGGMVNRIIKGLPDETQWLEFMQGFNMQGFIPNILIKNGYLYNGDRISRDTWSRFDTILYRASNDNEFWRDTEPDEFTFNINGFSGKFYFGTDRKAYVSGDPGIKVEYDTDAIGDDAAHFVYEKIYPLLSAMYYYNQVIISGFKITMPDGVVYEFGGYGHKLFNDYGYPTEYYYAIDSSTDFFSQVHIGGLYNTWHLKRIVSPDGDEITFKYAPGIDNEGHIRYCATFSKTTAFEWTGSNYTISTGLFTKSNRRTGASKNTFKDKIEGHIHFSNYLRRIESKTKKVDFSISQTTELTYKYGKIANDLQDKMVQNEYDRNIVGLSPRRVFFNGKFEEPGEIGKYFIVDRTDIDPSVDDNFINKIITDYILILKSDTLLNSNIIEESNKDYIELIDFNLMKWFKLDKIEVYDQANSECIKKWQFNYNNKKNERLMLLSLQESTPSGKTLPPYEFEYEDFGGHNKYGYIYSLPGYCTDSVDHWGYANHTNSSWVDCINLNNDYYGKRQTRIFGLFTGQLNKIIYPTGGSAEFTYEPHIYRKIVKRNPVSGIFSLNDAGNYFEEDTVAGGLRVKNIKYYDDNKLIREKTYQYSGGILNREVKYYWSGFKLRIPNVSNFEYYTNRFVSQNILPLCGGNDYHIGYSKVTEIESGNGKTEYYFSDHQTNPDDNFISSISDEKSFLSPYSSKEFERGLILKKIFYNEQNKRISEEKFTYTNNVLSTQQLRALHKDRYDVGNAWGYEGSAYYLNIYPYNRTIHKIINYDKIGANPIRTSKKHDYNLMNQLSLVTDSCSNGNTITQKLIYPIDVPAGLNDAVIQRMKMKNLLSPYIEKIEYMTDGTTSRVITGEYRKFAEKPTNIIKPEYVSILRTKGVLPISGVYNADDNRLVPELYYRYDTKGKIIEIKEHNGKYTSFLWGYNYQYPIAEIENATYEEVKTALGSITPDTLAAKTTPSESDFTAINNLRNNTALRKALITTYKFKPLVGMTSETDPSGRTVFYEYDDFGRLKYTKDENEHIVKDYQYHYKQ